MPQVHVLLLLSALKRRRVHILVLAAVCAAEVVAVREKAERRCASPYCISSCDR